MSIVTGRGDEGLTDLMYGVRISKTDPRVAAYGTLDELNACVGLARATVEAPALGEILVWLQKNLVSVMGELATAPESRERYAKDGFQIIGEAEVEEITTRARALEDDLQREEKGWAMPGETAALGAANLDLARTVCRRGERRALRLQESGDEPNTSIALWLNRCSDLLWIAARAEERHHKAQT